VDTLHKGDNDDDDDNNNDMTIIDNAVINSCNLFKTGITL
jgi:hypothetical protein